VASGYHIGHHWSKSYNFVLVSSVSFKKYSQNGLVPLIKKSLQLGGKKAQGWTNLIPGIPILSYPGHPTFLIRP
jgi:hypothetical protein